MITAPNCDVVLKLFVTVVFSIICVIGRTDAAETVPSKEFVLSDEISQVGVSRSGKFVAAALTTHKIHVLEASSGKVLHSLTSRGHTCEVLKFSTDEQKLFCQSTTGLLNGKRRFEVWNLQTEQQLLPENSRPLSDSFAADMSPDGGVLVFGGFGFRGIRTITLDSGAENVVGASMKLNCFAEIKFSFDGKAVVCATVDANAADPAASQKICVLDGLSFAPKAIIAVERRRIVGVLANGDLAIAEKGETDVRIINAISKKTLFSIKGDFDDYQEFGCISDGKRLIVVDKSAHIIDTSTGKILTEVAIPQNNRASWGYDGDFIVTSDGRQVIQLWKLKT